MKADTVDMVQLMAAIFITGGLCGYGIGYVTTPKPVVPQVASDPIVFTCWDLKANSSLVSENHIFSCEKADDSQKSPVGNLCIKTDGNGPCTWYPLRERNDKLKDAK